MNDSKRKVVFFHQDFSDGHKMTYNYRFSQGKVQARVVEVAKNDDEARALLEKIRLGYVLCDVLVVHSSFPDGRELVDRLWQEKPDIRIGVEGGQLIRSRWEKPREYHQYVRQIVQEFKPDFVFCITEDWDFFVEQAKAGKIIDQEIIQKRGYQTLTREGLVRFPENGRRLERE